MKGWTRTFGTEQRGFTSQSNPVSTTIATYDQRAAYYLGTRGGGDLTRHFAAFTERVRAGSLVVDVGCGPGWHSVELARRGLRVVSLDLSRGMLREAQTLGARDLAQADMRRLPIASASADGFWVMASFLHVPRADADATLNEFHRVLKPHGVLYLGVKGGEGERFGNPLDGLPRYFVYWREDELDAKLRAAGFEIVTAWTDAPEEKATRMDTWINRVVVSH